MDSVSNSINDSSDDLAGAFNLHPPQPIRAVRGVEALAERLFSVDHLNLLVREENLLAQFTTFIHRFRPDLAKTLQDFVESQKILAALGYANALSDEILQGISAAIPNTVFEERAKTLTESLVNEALPAYITHKLVHVVTDTLFEEIRGQTTPVIRELIGGGVESFCLTDPALEDNPIVFASEEFFKTTQYGLDYVIGRNSRFLQGPATSPHAKARLCSAVQNFTQAQEIILNYHRSGSPFFNLLMLAPLFDHKGRVMYFIGAQIDVTKLIEDGKGLESFSLLLANDLKKKSSDKVNGLKNVKLTPLEEKTLRLKELTQLWSKQESSIVTRFRSIRHKYSESDKGREAFHTPKTSPSKTITSPISRSHSQKNTSRGYNRNGKDGHALHHIDNALGSPISPHHGRPYNSLPGGAMPGIFADYLLVRPYPDLTITFASPGLKSSGLLHSSFPSHLGGMVKQLNDIKIALKEGTGISGLVIWLANPRADNSCETSSPQPETSHSVSQLENSLQSIVTTDDDGDVFGSPRTTTLMILEGTEKPVDGLVNGTAFRDKSKPIVSPGPVQFDSAYGRWKTIHCTPLFGSDSNVGVWMILLLEMDINPLDLSLPLAFPGALLETPGGRPLSTEHNSVYFWGSRVNKLPFELAQSTAVIHPDPFRGHRMSYGHSITRLPVEASLVREGAHSSQTKILEEEPENSLTSNGSHPETTENRNGSQAEICSETPFEPPPLPPTPNSATAISIPQDLHLLPSMPPSPPPKTSNASPRSSSSKRSSKIVTSERRSSPAKISIEPPKPNTSARSSKVLAPTKSSKKEFFRKSFSGSLRGSLRRVLLSRSPRARVPSANEASPVLNTPRHVEKNPSQPTTPKFQKPETKQPSTADKSRPQDSMSKPTADVKLSLEQDAILQIEDKEANVVVGESLPTPGEMIGIFPIGHPLREKQIEALRRRDEYRRRRERDIKNWYRGRITQTKTKGQPEPKDQNHSSTLRQLLEEERRSIYDREQQDYSHHHSRLQGSQGSINLSRPTTNSAVPCQKVPSEQFFSGAVMAPSSAAAARMGSFLSTGGRYEGEYPKLTPRLVKKTPPKALRWLSSLSLRWKKNTTL